MSQESIGNECKQPKKFLKKGEGLKRFAAFKPPLPVTGRKSERRQTFVKFKLENNIYSKILDDDSINLSTEIPKIPPPKIMHTPIRPRAHIYGALRPIPFNVPEDLMEDFTNPLQSQSPPLPALAKHRQLSKSQAATSATANSSKPTTNATETATVKSAKQKEQSTGNVEPKRYNLRGARKQTPETNEAVQQPRETKKAGGRGRKIKALVERHVGGPMATGEPQSQEEASDGHVISESAINGELDNLLKKIEDRKSSLDGIEDDHGDDPHATAANLRTPIMPQKYTVASDLSTPSPGNYLFALSRKIEQIEATVNELKDRVKNCECGALLSTPKHGPTTRATRKTAACTNQNKTTNANSTPDLMKHLVKIVEELKLQELKRLDGVSSQRG